MKYLFCFFLFFPVLAGETQDEARIAAMVDRYANFAAQGEDIHGLDSLFKEDFVMFEQGGMDPSWASYRDHHLGPELKAFESFSTSDEKKTVRVKGEVAWVTQTMNYHIVLKKDGREIHGKATVTYLLEKVRDDWKFIHIHWSYRPIKK